MVPPVGGGGPASTSVTTDPASEGSAGSRPGEESGDLGSGLSPAQTEGPNPAGKVKNIQKPVYYVSKVLHEAKARYPETHKLLYAILIASRKLYHYFQAHKIVVVTSYPLRGHTPQFQHHGQYRQVGSRACWVSTQLLATPRHQESSPRRLCCGVDTSTNCPRGSGPWVGPPTSRSQGSGVHRNFFDRSVRNKKAGAGVVLIDPSGEQVKYMVLLDFEATINMAEYKALIFGLTVALSLGVRELLVKGDSQLVIRQVRGECCCNNPQLVAYLIHMRKLEKDFDVLELQHVPCEGNSVADALSAKASTQAPVPEGIFQRRLLKPSAQPAGLGKGGRTSTSKLAVPAALHPWSLPRVVCTLEGPEDLREPRPITQEGPDAWISKI
jgi:ribonuclease HI